MIADLKECAATGSALAPDVTSSETISVRHVYSAHSNFVWLTLQRFGVRESDLEDTLHEVFLVVHQRLHTFDGTSKMTTWLYGISLRVASAYRRRGHRRREVSSAEPVGPVESARGTPETDLAIAQARRRLTEILDDLDLDKRAVFTMFEIDEMSCEEIGEILDIPVGTVYSRLHAARASFQQALVRMQARDARRASKSGGSR